MSIKVIISFPYFVDLIYIGFYIECLQTHLTNPTMDQISDNVPFCNRNHFCYRMVHCGIWDNCIVGFVRWFIAIATNTVITYQNIYEHPTSPVLNGAHMCQSFYHSQSFRAFLIWKLHFSMRINSKQSYKYQFIYKQYITWWKAIFIDQLLYAYMKYSRFARYATFFQHNQYV